MRIAIIADVHSNLHALKSAVDTIRSHAPDLVVCAGDIIGYGAFPNECCSIVEGLCDHAILGNHEKAVLSRDISGMNPFAAAAALWTADVLDDRSRSYIAGLRESTRFETQGKEFAVFHGSVSDPHEYVYEDRVTEELVAEAECAYLVLGHTHIPYARSFSTGVAVNPGSIGQPRDGNPRGSLAIIDTCAKENRVIRFDYPIEEAASAIISAGLPRILAERLPIGR